MKRAFKRYSMVIDERNCTMELFKWFNEEHERKGRDFVLHRTPNGKLRITLTIEK